MQDNHCDQIPRGRAWLWIFLWTLAISGSAWMGWLYYLHLKHWRMQNEQYRIIAIMQSTPQVEALKTIYLAELLQLSLDRPVNLYQFDTEKGKRLLLSSPLIKQAEIKKIHPGTLYVEYLIRMPVAYLGDYTNTALDDEGYLFPFSPFFTPKKLPLIYMGFDHVGKRWGSCLMEDQRLKLAFQVLKTTQKLGKGAFAIKKIDVSQAFADSYGQRQIVVWVEEQIEQEKASKQFAKLFLLRLHTENYPQNLANYLVLKPHLMHTALNADPSIIDLRLPHLAFIKKDL